MIKQNIRLKTEKNMTQYKKENFSKKFLFNTSLFWTGQKIKNINLFTLQAQNSQTESYQTVSTNVKLASDKQLIRRYIIIGERRIINYCWAIVIFVGAFGFFFKGISSSDDIPFIPQGLLMSFYGSLGILVSIYWFFLIFWNVGGGFNEFNKKEGFIRIFRWGYPGKNRRIDFSYPLKNVEAIKVELKQGLDPQRTIYIRLRLDNSTKGIREIPLTGLGQPLTLKEIEKQASELANYLQVSLEGL